MPAPALARPLGGVTRALGQRAQVSWVVAGGGGVSKQLWLAAPCVAAERRAAAGGMCRRPALVGVSPPPPVRALRLNVFRPPYALPVDCGAVQHSTEAMALRGGASWLNPAHGRPRAVWCAVALLVLSFLMLTAMQGGRKAAKHAVRAFYYSTDPLFLGR